VATELFLIRHGESVANVEPVIGGMTGDAGLTDRGRRQAELLRDRLRAEGPRADVLYASTLPRARQTAGYVSDALGVPVREEAELHELRPGQADGLSVAEWMEAFPGWENGPFSRPFQPFATDGESWAAFLARTGTVLTRLVSDHPGQTVVAVTHGGVIESSFFLAFGLGASTVPVGFAPSNTSITHWHHDPGPRARARWTLVRFNDDRHLVADGRRRRGRARPAAVPRSG
jgi:2,3-bisphosphoglycerate-dependent phosphoglycerate mutase